MTAVAPQSTIIKSALLTRMEHGNWKVHMKCDRKFYQGKLTITLEIRELYMRLFRNMWVIKWFYLWPKKLSLIFSREQHHADF